MNSKKVQLAEVKDQRLGLVALTESGTEILLVEGNSTREVLVAPTVPPKRRIPGLHPGSMETSADFDAPLPEDFWLGVE